MKICSSSQHSPRISGKTHKKKFKLQLFGNKLNYSHCSYELSNSKSIFERVLRQKQHHPDDSVTLRTRILDPPPNSQFRFGERTSILDSILGDDFDPQIPIGRGPRSSILSWGDLDPRFPLGRGPRSYFKQESRTYPPKLWSRSKSIRGDQSQKFCTEALAQDGIEYRGPLPRGNRGSRSSPKMEPRIEVLPRKESDCGHSNYSTPL